MKKSSLLSFAIRILALNILPLSAPVTAYGVPGEYTPEDIDSKKIQTLDDLCSHSVEGSVQHFLANGNSLNSSIRQAAATTLNDIQKQFPHNQISRCVIILPDGKPVDETIEHFNRNKAPENKENTAFLVIGSGIRTALKNPAERGEGLRLVNAESSRYLLPKHWQGNHNVNKTIVLEKGQKLVGIPLTPDLKLAKNFYIGLEASSEMDSSTTFDVYHNKSLINSSEIGVLITGISTAPFFLSNADRDNTTTAPAITFELLNFDLNPEIYSTDIQPEKNLINIFNNELVQSNRQSLSVFADETLLYSEKIEGKTLFNIKDNYFYSYDNQSTPRSPYLFINDYSYIDFHYTLKNDSFLKVERNYFFGECKKSPLGDTRDITEKYFIQNNLFECWTDGDNPSNLKLKNNPIPINHNGSGENNRVFRYISYQNKNEFRGALYLPGFDLQTDSEQQTSAFHRRRFAREAKQDNESKPDTNSNTKSSGSNDKVLIYATIGGVVINFGLTMIHMAWSYLNWIKTRALENRLKGTTAPRTNDMPRTPQVPRGMGGYGYQQFMPYQQNHPEGSHAVAVPVYPVQQPQLPMLALPSTVEECTHNNDRVSTSGASTSRATPSRSDYHMEIKTVSYKTREGHKRPLQTSDEEIQQLHQSENRYETSL